jgi:hypothetical protein
MKQLLAIVALAYPFLCGEARAQDSPGVVWMNNLEKATQVALDSGKPMLVVFR